MRVNVVPYDLEWPEQYAAVRRELEAALPDVVVAIEHVGSTAVPGLASKPVIDVDVVVQAGDVAAAIAALQVAGYAYEGEKGVPDRHAFTAPVDDIQRHVYVCVSDSLALRNHLAVRDLLRTDEALRDEYASVKLALAQQEVATIDAYVARKSQVLQHILRAAGLSAADRAAVARSNPMLS